ncbi:MAG: CYTH domain-containing protein [Chloroflexota bacterium]|nr:CYTH domain-containing protein [Chloroflexota bacterium]
MEVEAKYRAVEAINPEDIEALDLAPYTLGPREFHDLHDTLLDTAERDIGRYQYALRVRRDGEKVFLTLKGPKIRQGNTTWRPEWEEALDNGDPDDVTSWPPIFQEQVRLMSDGKSLLPQLHVRNRRYTWMLYRQGAQVAEIALDRGTIHAGEAEEPMHELEVELKGGDEADLNAIVAMLRSALPLVTETRGKAERGFALLAKG